MSTSPPSKRSDCDDAAFLSTRYGLTPDDWQLLVLRSWLAVRSDGKWAASRCGLAVPRQNGKNAVIEIRELFGMVTMGEKFLHTAHEVKTARKAFKRLASFFENPFRFPELTALVSDIRNTNGQESIVLNNGGSCEFVARSKGSGRGFTADVLVMDEAQDLTDEHIEALLPTISAPPLGSPQQIFTGTPPGPTVSGDIFTRIRTEGLGGKDRRLSWHEWSCPPDADLDDALNLARANPALGIRVDHEVVEAERATLSDDGFGRERLGMWASATTQAVIDAQTWAACADDKSVLPDRIAIAVDVNPERTRASISAAGLRSDGLWHVEFRESREGVGWVVDYLVRRCENNNVGAVVLDATSPAASVVDDLKRRDVKVTAVGARDMAAACGTFYDYAMEGKLRHVNDPGLNYAVSMGRRRNIGDAWGWNRKTSTSDITPLVSATLALWGAQKTAQAPDTRVLVFRR